MPRAACFRSLFITSNLPQDRGCLGLSQVERQEQGLLHDRQVRPRDQIGKDVLPALGAGDVLAPRSAVVRADQEIEASGVVRRFE